MRLERVHLQNFRQFYGSHSLTLKTSGDRNVTVVYAANGAGKTTLLNAFTWAFYKVVGDDFEQPDRLINSRAWDECPPGDSRATEVAIEFEHDGVRYTMTRLFQARKAKNGAREVLVDGDATLRAIGPDGESRAIQNPTNALSQMLPERLHQFFFFNGERIENLAKPSAYTQIEEAIKTLLGLEIVERGQRHLDQAAQQLRKDLKSIPGTKSDQIVDQLTGIRARQTDLADQRQGAAQELASLREERSKIAAKLGSMEATRGLQERREQLTKRIEDSEATVSTLKGFLGRTIADQGFVAFTSGLTEQILELIDKNRERGELPTPIKRQFVEDLLEAGTCICGTPLAQGSEHFQAVAEWRHRAGLADVEEALIRTGAKAASFGEERRSIQVQVAQLSGDIFKQSELQRELKEELDEVSTKLKNGPLEEAKALEIRRDEIEGKLARSAAQVEMLEKQLEAAKAEERAKEKELDHVKEANAEAQLAQRRAHAAAAARDLLAEVHEIRSQEVREELEELVKDVYARISYKPYEPTLTEGFQLELHDQNGNRVPQSTGENQILSLSFVGALAALARRRHQASERDALGALIGGFEGGSYPVVMDAPFGQLDDNYRREVAQALPILADQIVVLASKSQGLGVVHQELAPRIGREYVIHFSTSKPEFEPEMISIGGHEYPYISRSDNGWDTAVIEEVT